jgi:predicted O-methyltransferase YrrM
MIRPKSKQDPLFITEIDEAPTMPWMGQDEIDIILSYLKPTMTMLELGSGGSTLFFSKYVNEYHSVETEKAWYDLIKKHTKPANADSNITYHYKQEGIELESFSANLCYQYDAILIDTFSPRWKLLKSLEKCVNQWTIIFLHDFFAQNRLPLQTEAKKYYKIIDWSIHEQSLAVCKRK